MISTNSIASAGKVGERRQVGETGKSAKAGKAGGTKTAGRSGHSAAKNMKPRGKAASTSTAGTEFVNDVLYFWINRKVRGLISQVEDDFQNLVTKGVMVCIRGRIVQYIHPTLSVLSVLSVSYWRISVVLQGTQSLSERIQLLLITTLEP